MKSENQKPGPIRNVSLFFQLGLVASLFLAYFVLELETEKKSVEYPDTRLVSVEAPSNEYVSKVIIEKEPLKKEPIKTAKVLLPIPSDHLKIVDNKETEPLDIKNVFFIDSGHDEDDLIDIPKPTSTPIIHEVATLDTKPTFMACAHLKGEAREKCFKEQLTSFFKKNLNYPESAQNSGTQGTVLVEFIVSNKGNITGIRPLRKALSPELEKEALKAVSKLPNMSPGISNGVPVDVRYVLPVSFKLNQ